jgi:putrescine aminotransferase
VFYGSSGSESNDTIVRMVRHYWATLGQPERQVIISRKNAYHGSTMCGASLGGMTDMHAQGGLPIPGIVHIEQPYHFGQAPGKDKDAFGVEAAGWLEKRILELGADKVAAFIGEPVQGAGGVIIPPKTYWPEIQRICDKYGILLICDEVICGFGRLGRWFGSELMGAKPDLMTFAKGVTSGYIPLGGVVVGKRVAEVLIEKGGEFNHGYTYAGHPVACAVALTNLAIIEREGLVDRVREETGPHLANHFAALSDHPLVAGAESLGMVAGLVLMKDKSQQLAFDKSLGVGMICRDHCFANGLIMRAVGDRMIIAPPLVCTKSQIDEMMERVRYCLDATLKDLQSRGLMDTAN